MNTFKKKLLILAGCFFLCIGTIAQSRYPVCGPQTQFYSKDSIRVVTFGASTVEGTPKPLNFQSSLKAFIDNCYKNKVVTISNFGIGGETTAQGLARIDLALNDQAEFFLILMGANDAIRITDNLLRLNMTIANMRAIIEKAQAKKLDVILGTLQYFVESRGTPAQRLLSRRRNRNIDLINNAYRSIAREYNIRLADINATLGKNEALFSDDVHPNQRGYEVLSLVWFDEINQEISANFQSVGVVQNYPNPANTYTKIGFTLSSASRVRIVLYNSSGQNMGVIFDDYRNAGYQEEQITTSQYPAGIYIIYYELLGLKFSKKLIITH
jgi:acyl-CoA thioesterase-1